MQAHTLFIPAAGGGFEAVTDCPAKLPLSTESPPRPFPVLLFDATFVINSDKSSDSSPSDVFSTRAHSQTHILHQSLPMKAESEEATKKEKVMRQQRQ